MAAHKTVREGELNGRLALVTGASRGIGYHLALALAQKGAHIIAVARTVGGLEELDDAIKAQNGTGGATLVPLDLKKLSAIDQLGGHIHERWGKLDILVANAGVLGVLSPTGHIEAKAFDEVMAVNVTSQWRLMRTTDPLLAKSDAGRAIIMSSGAAHKCKPFWGPYSASKAAVEVLARTWAAERQNSPLKVNCVNPGATRTAMRAKAMPGEDASTLPKPSQVAQTILPLASLQTTETGMLFDVRTNQFQTYLMPRSVD